MIREPLTLTAGTLSPGVPLLTLSGRIECEDCPELRLALILALNTSCHAVLDITAVPYLDSSAIGVLVDAYRHARASGGEVWLVGATPFVTRAFEITRLCKIFPMVETLADARGWIEKRQAVAEAKRAAPDAKRAAPDAKGAARVG